MLTETLKNTRQGSLPGNGRGGFCIVTAEHPSPGSFVMEEIWKDIEDYKGLYKVSNLGRIKGLKKNVIRKQFKNNKSYLCVTLSKNNHINNKTVHRIVAKSFIPNPDNLPEVNHIDCIKNNNCVNNLEWCTSRYNYDHAKLNGAYLNISGENNHMNVLTKKQAAIVKYGDKDYKEYAKMFNVHRSTTHNIIKGMNWKHITRSDLD